MNRNDRRSKAGGFQSGLSDEQREIFCHNSGCFARLEALEMSKSCLVVDKDSVDGVLEVAQIMKMN